GLYTFNHLVDLEDVSTGIAITNADAEAGGLYTFSKVAIDNATSAALMIDGGQSVVTINGLITQNAPTAGLAVDIKGGHSGTLTFNEKTTGEGVIVATAGAGLAFNDADGTYDFNHAIRLSGDMTAGISITGDSGGRFDFDNAAITNIDGVAFNLNGGTADVNFTGKITQTTGAQAAVNVEGGHTGSITFNEQTTDAGVIVASSGAGLTFNQADGLYTFNHLVDLDNLVNGISITDSDGSFTFAKATIDDATGAALLVNGGSANVNFTGLITQDAAGAGYAVDVLGSHTGTINLSEKTSGEGVIIASQGGGLRFTDADGTYNVNHKADLDNLAVGIDITDSDGTFKFSNALIDDATVAAVRIDGGEANVNFTGLITQDAAGAGYATHILGEHTGTVTFNEVTSGAGVIVASTGPGLLFNEADGLYTYNHKITLSGGAVVDVVDSEGTINFNSTASKISNSSGTAFTVENGSATVSYNGTIATTGGKPVELIGNTGGTVTFNGKIESTDEGILVQNNTAGTFRFNGLVDLDTTTEDAISLLGNATASEVVFTNLDVTTTTGDGLVADGGTLTVTGTTNKLAATGGTALSLTGVTIGASGARFQSVSADGGTNGIVLNGLTGGALSVGLGGNSPGDGGTIQNTTGHGVMVTNCANVSLNNMLVTGAGGDGINLSHTGAGAFNVTIADSNLNNNAAQGIALNANGTGNMRLTLNDNVLTQNGAESIEVTVGASAGNTYVTLNNNDINNTSGDQAFLMTVNGGTTYLLATGGNFVSNSTDPAFDVIVNPNAKLNATVTDNSFASSAGLGLRVWNTGDGATVRLSMLDNQATSASQPALPYQLRNDASSAGAFSVEKRTTPVPADPMVDQEPDANMRNGADNRYDPGDSNTWIIDFNKGGVGGNFNSFTTDSGNIPTP
ncbi:MAG: right-handed parallel beta-helix repeat-containing protein, partial [Pirellulaceae bacterium]|nr:right-handed parallel beta-helix repeat-containing protein [Pirellulaceae bacterium]